MNRALISNLSPTEKLQLIEALWDDISTTPEAIPIPEWQKEELLRRKAADSNSSSPDLTWEEVKSGVRARHGR